MLDRAVVEEFLDYEWLKDNFKSFFEHGEPDWEWIREKVRR